MSLIELRTVPVWASSSLDLFLLIARPLPWGEFVMFRVLVPNLWCQFLEKEHLSTHMHISKGNGFHSYWTVNHYSKYLSEGYKNLKVHISHTTISYNHTERVIFRRVANAFILEEELCFAFPWLKILTMVFFKIRESMCPKGEFKSLFLSKLKLLWGLKIKLFLISNIYIQNSKIWGTNLVSAQEICTFFSPQQSFPENYFSQASIQRKLLALRWWW